MTDEKIKLFEAVMSNSKLTPAQVAALTNMFNTPKPQVIITVEGGSVQDASANMDIELVIADVDNIKRGDDLDYLCLSGYTQESFDKYLKTVQEQVKKPVSEVRIFIHDPEDEFPYNMSINGDVISTHRTFEDAYQSMREYLL